MEQDTPQHAAHDIDTFYTALQNLGLSFEALDDTTLVVPAEGIYPLLLTTIHVMEEQTTLDTLYPFQAPVERRARTVELAAHLNPQLNAGALTPNPDDGDLGFRTYLPIRADRITITLATEALKQHWAAANRVLPGLAVVVFTDFSLTSAIEQNQATIPIDEVVRSVVRRLDAD